MCGMVAQSLFSCLVIAKFIDLTACETKIGIHVFMEDIDNIRCEGWMSRMHLSRCMSQWKNVITISSSYHRITEW